MSWGRVGRWAAAAGAAATAAVALRSSGSSRGQQEVALGHSPRLRLLPPPWLAWLLPRASRPRQPTGEQLAELYPPFAAQLRSQFGLRRLPSPPAGTVSVSLQPQTVLPPAQAAAVEAAARVAAAELAGERQGLLLALLPGSLFFCCAAGASAVLLSTGTVQACFEQTAAPRAALSYLLAHEAAHVKLRHVEEKQLATLAWRADAALRTLAAQIRGSWAALAQHGLHVSRQQLAAASAEAVAAEKLALARTLQELDWTQELEADEAAARALAQAGVPSEQWAAGLSLLTEDARAPEWRLEEQAEGDWVVRLRVHDEQEAAFVEQAKSLLGLLHTALREGDPRQPALAGPAGGGLHAEHDRPGTAGLPRQRRLRRRYPTGSSSAVNRHSAAAAFQQRLGWDVPPSWFDGLPPGVQAAAVLTLLDSHPPTALREARLQELAAAVQKGQAGPA